METIQNIGRAKEDSTKRGRASSEWESMIKRSLLFIFILVFNSCNVKDDNQARIFSLNYIEENEVLLSFLFKELNKANLSDTILFYFSTKPGSHILFSDWQIEETMITKESQTKIANFIDMLDLSSIKYKKNAFVEYTFKLRNYNFDYYFIRNYSNLEDTIIYSLEHVRSYNLGSNWVLYSR
ncbi:MAG: hypothetical protein LBR75_05365 [Prevotellaceae bacterium]|jgi:hypothetical protein|nr:hypothetical protein [Prevotellaceae bacterium]